MKYLMICVVLLSSIPLTTRASDTVPELSDNEIEQLKIIHLISMAVVNLRNRYSQLGDPPLGKGEELAEYANKKKDQYKKYAYTEHFANELNESYWDFLHHLSKCELNEVWEVVPDTCDISYARTRDEKIARKYKLEMELSYSSDQKLINSYKCDYFSAGTNSLSIQCSIDTVNYGIIEASQELAPLEIKRDDFELQIRNTVNYAGKTFEYGFVSKVSRGIKNIGAEVYLNDRKFDLLGKKIKLWPPRMLPLAFR